MANNGTRKSKSKLLFEENREMYNQARPWANLVPSVSRNTNNSNSPRTNKSRNEAVEGYTPPNLTLRKGIWENFPVVLTDLGRENGVEKYGVTWHNRNLQQWKKERAESWDEFLEYEAWAEARLRHSLLSYAHLYRMEPPRSADQLFVIAMLSNTNTRKAPRQNATATATATATTELPKLRFLNDIKTHFPVVWPHTGKITKGDVIRLEFHRKNLKTEATQAGVPLETYTAQVQRRLIDALRASDSWEVLPAWDATSICSLRMLR